MIGVSALIKLLVAHLLGDFMFQPDSLCRFKQSLNPKFRYYGLAVHSTIQALLSYIFLGAWSNWEVPAVIFISHFIIDFIKVNIGRYDIVSFIADQILHVVVIVGVWWFMLNGNIGCSAGSDVYNQLLIIVAAILMVLQPCSIFIKLFMEREGWNPVENQCHGLPNAGKWIGYLERILILIFILTDNFEGVGFLLAAKSVFRFGELNKAKDVKLTEYILIGTFLSFTIAVLAGFATTKLL